MHRNSITQPDRQPGQPTRQADGRLTAAAVRGFESPAGRMESLDSRQFDSIEIQAVQTDGGNLEVHVFDQSAGRKRRVAHLVEDGRVNPKAGAFYLPFRIEDHTRLDELGIMPAEIGHIRDIDPLAREEVEYDRLNPNTDYPEHCYGNRMPESSFEAMQRENDGFTGLRVKFGEDYLKRAFNRLGSEAMAAEEAKMQ